MFVGAWSCLGQGGELIDMDELVVRDIWVFRYINSLG